jgi:hypothetical protein
MTDGTPGWYLDRDDPSLARWHDGTDWTEHTLVIADQEPGSEPPPPPAVRRPSDAQLQRERVAAAEEKKAQKEARAAGGFPKWAPIAVAVVVGILAAGLFATLSGDDDDDPTTLDTQGVSIEEALETARDAGFPSQIGDSRARGLIEDLCEAAERPARTATLSAELERLPLQPAQLRRAISALGEGAEAYCPDQRSGVNTAVSQLQRQAGGDDELATATTFPSADGGVVDGSASTIPGAVDPNATATTKKATTATTKKPTTGTTVAASTTVPPTTTTTIVTHLKGSACSSEGATSVTKSGAPLVCRKSCFGGSSTRWDIDEPCPTIPTAPTN